jgi:hypothetical protein
MWLEERKIYYASNNNNPKWLQGFYASELGSKQVGRTKADMAVRLSLGGYNLSYYTRSQLITLPQGYSIPH